MTLDELIQTGWAQHHEDTAGVADRLDSGVDLVSDAGGAAKYMNLVNHCIGGHLKDRSRALRLCEAASERLGGEMEGAPALYLAVARRLGGDPTGADALLALLGGDKAATVRLQMLVAEGHMNAEDWDRADSLYRETLAIAESLDPGHAAERSVAVVSNNIASALLEITRSDEQTELMRVTAEASRVFWMRIGTWVNDERADYLLSLVSTSAGQPSEGRVFAERGLQTIADNGGGEPVDQAFLHLAAARAARDCDEPEAQARALAAADALATEFDKGLVDWFQTERKKSI